jgi:hypothetical protein
MNDKIAEILKNAISGLNFVDKITGLVQVGYLTQAEFKKKTGKEFAYGELEVIKFPMSQGLIGCENKPYSYDDYLPTKNKKSIIFFEDQGCQVLKQNRKQTDYQSSLRLVCWFNKKLIDPDIQRNDLIQNLLLLLVDEHPNTSDINRVYVEFKGQEIHSEDIFSKYDLDEAMYQVMMWPYDCFALNFEVLFTINQSCVKEIELKPLEC